jgi:hypothetical protein
MSDLLSAQAEPKKVFPPSGIYVPNVVAAGGTQIIRAAGDHFYFAESTGRLLVGTDLTAEAPYSVGEGEEIPEGFEFKTVTLRNDTAEDITFEIFVGRNRRIDRRLNVVDGRLASVERVMNNSTKLYCSAVTAIANAATETFDGVATGTQIQRKSIIVTNEDPTNILDWSDGTNTGGKIGPGEKIELELAGSIDIENNSGSSITCKISEIWYDTDL